MIDTALILAAGRGSRLKEVTANRSKAMAPIAGKPIIGRVIDSLRDAGISHFIVIGAPHDTELKRFCASLANTLFLIQERPLGSGDALRSAADHAPDRFIVCACDSLIPSSDIQELVIRHTPESVATLSVIEVDPSLSLSARSVVAVHDDRVTDFIEKPKESERFSNLSSLPLYVLTRNIFPALARLGPSPRGEYELPEVFREYIQTGKVVRAVRASNRFDLTDQRDLLALNERFLKELTPDRQIHPSVMVPPSAVILAPVLIEEGVVIGANTTVGPLVFIERNAVIESERTVAHTVVLRGARVSRDERNTVVV